MRKRKQTQQENEAFRQARADAAKASEQPKLAAAEVAQLVEVDMVGAKGWNTVREIKWSAPDGSRAPVQADVNTWGGGGVQVFLFVIYFY